MEEYELFVNWFENTLRRGLYSFYFPKIDSLNKSTLAVYKFTADGVPQFSNPSGDMINVTMKWEQA